MTSPQEHLSFEVLNDFVDGRLAREQRDAVEHHIASCYECRLDHDSLQRVLAGAAMVPPDVLPVPDLWPELRSVLVDRKVVSLPRERSVPRASTSPDRGHSSVLRRRLPLAAAAVLLMALSSGITATVLLIRGKPNPVAYTEQIDAPATVGAQAPVVPAGFRSAESEYLRAFTALRAVLDAQRHQLRPQTVATIERSLAVVDSAIVEARAALLADPNNTVLLDLLSAGYQHKLDLLRRASELGSRT